MTDGSPAPHWIVDAMLGVWIAVTGWFSRRFVQQVDDQEVRLNKLEVITLTRDDFKEYVRQLRDERTLMHTENKDSIKDLREEFRTAVEGLHDDILNLAKGGPR